MSICLVHSKEPELEPLLDLLTIPALTASPEPGLYDVVIQWGGYCREKPGQRRLQSVRNVLRAEDPNKSAALLQLHGIVYEPSGNKRTSGWPYIYRIPVFHLEALTIFQKKEEIFYTPRSPKSSSRRAAPFVELGPRVESYHANRAKREALKTIYALGLDYGVVTVGIRDARSPIVVLHVEPAPKLDNRLAELYAEAIGRYEEQLLAEKNRQSSVVLGMDPEFLLRDAFGQVVFADRFMDKHGLFGCDSIVLPDRTKIYPLAELRPGPSADIRQLVSGLQRAMRLAERKVNDPHLEWVAGGMPSDGYPLGGHIHFSSVWLNVHLLRALDNYLALPLLLIEDETTGRRRPKYGFLGDFRRKPHGFEYRTLPSWLVSPAVTKGVLALAKLIAEHYRELIRDPLQHADTQTFYYRGDKAAVRKMLPYLWNDIEKTASYPQYQSYISPLKTSILSMKSWNEQEDIRKRWKIAPYSEKSGTPGQFMV